MLLERYGAYLPVTAGTPRLTLGEGGTPLLQARRLGAEIGCERLYLKVEGMNPTGSFKDRGMVLAVAKALEQGAERLICASTGNTAASAAAYASAAGMPCLVVLPANYVAAGKLAQATTYGATVISVDGSFDQALAAVREAAEELRAELVNSVNEFRIEGQKTAAFEVCDELPSPPDVVAVPVGNAGNITAYWRGFTEYHRSGMAKTLPRMWGFQAAGAAPLVVGRPVQYPRTVATAIRIGQPARGEQAKEAVRESAGVIDAVTDEEIMSAHRLVARCEGVMCEPASAAAIAGLLKLKGQGESFAYKTIVAVLTGHGLKDPDAALTTAVFPEPIEPTTGALLRQARKGA